MAIRPLLIGLTLIAALVLIILSILLVDTSRPTVAPGSLMPAPSGAGQQP